MASLYNYYRYQYARENQLPQYIRDFLNGWEKLNSNALFHMLEGEIHLTQKYVYDKQSAASVEQNGNIYVNAQCRLSPDEWVFTLAHCLLHLAFGHFDKEYIPESVYTVPDTEASDTERHSERKLALWNKACDIYVTRFLIDIHVGLPTCPDPADEYKIKLNSEEKIYEHLLWLGESGEKQTYGTSSHTHRDMHGLEHPADYSVTAQTGHGQSKMVSRQGKSVSGQGKTVSSQNKSVSGQGKTVSGTSKTVSGRIGQNSSGSNPFVKRFHYALAHLTSSTISEVSGYLYDEKEDTEVKKAARWFISSYPLLGSMAASFKIIEDTAFCIRNEIEIAAVDAIKGEIYVNPACGYSETEWQFVLAHEFLHAGLMHHKRINGRNPYLWNVACDYIINGWLVEMQIGTMPSSDLLYDEDLAGMSAEAIYDQIEKNIKKYLRRGTFRGYKKGDILSGGLPSFGGLHEGVTLDEFYSSALREGLEYHNMNGRGLIPAGLMEEIYALAMPPIPWDVELGRWFDEQFPPLENHRTYARPSRRQSATPDIPRPRTVPQEMDEMSRTFGVVVDTSGSMSSRLIGKALGSIASYATAKDVPLVRVIFCDAAAYDAGYLKPEEAAGKVEVTGRGGTILQPGVTKLLQAKDFPTDAPILIITDGCIEESLLIPREHAYLIPKGNRLPFPPKGKVFRFGDS
ncbi:MAG: hypothetical protein LUI87_02700 [Lachnospiraceae bacterium]|nr:hypothetical protein [Lachnospiraceae bacterium]